MSLQRFAKLASLILFSGSILWLMYYTLGVILIMSGSTPSNASQISVVLSLVTSALLFKSGIRFVK